MAHNHGGGAPPPSLDSYAPYFAVAGNPNSGKTTLFNHLTGLRQKVANYPGVTVEKVEGEIAEGSLTVRLIDLPGTYSLNSRSEEERIASEVITGIRGDTPRISGVVCVLDSTNLQRGLYLVLQVLETRVPIILVLNMMDELAARGGSIEVVKLSRLLGVPVHATSAVKGEGLEKLKRDLLGRAQTFRPRKLPLARPFSPDDLRKATLRQMFARRIAHSVIRGPRRTPYDHRFRGPVHVAPGGWAPSFHGRRGACVPINIHMGPSPHGRPG